MRDKRIVKKAVWETGDGITHDSEVTAINHQQKIDLRKFFMDNCNLGFDDAEGVARVLLTQFKIEKFPVRIFKDGEII